MGKLTLLPAIDVQNGQAVRLTQGELSDKQNYGSPLDVAREFIDTFSQAHSQGADFTPWVHLVDLNAAFGDGDNAELILQVTKLLNEHNVNVELSGGIRNSESLERALSANVARVNIGTAALENPAWTAEIIGKYGAKIGIGLDVRGETLAARGWVKEGGNIWGVMEKLLQDGVSRLVITDVTKDGTLSGTNNELLRQAADYITSHYTGHPTQMPHITASGGISSLDDIAAVGALTTQTNGIVDSVIFGKAMYNGKFTLLDALLCDYS